MNPSEQYTNVNDNKSGRQELFSKYRHSSASDGMGLNIQEPKLLIPRDAVTHERLIRVIKDQKKNAPKRQYGK